MAANFWTSNHRVNLVSEEEFHKVHRSIMIRGIDQATVQQLKDYFCLRIYKMTKALKTARIRVAATACFYFHRFFLKYSFDQHDPRMIVPACIYLSVKANENNIQKSKTYTALALEHDPSLLDVFTTKMLLDNEVLLLQALDCDLLVFSAHTDTVPLLESIKKVEGMNKAVNEEHVDAEGKPVLARIAWNVINDAYMCGACNIEPPCDVAIACLLHAAKQLGIDCVEWLRHQEIEPDAMIRVLTHVTEFRERERLTDEEVLQLLRRIGCKVLS